MRDVRGPLYLLWGAALAVLVIGVGNLGNIALARSRARLNELGTRLAIGAGRFDVVRRLLVEGFLIAISGAAGGLALGAWVLSALRMREMGAAQLHIDAAVDTALIRGRYFDERDNRPTSRAIVIDERLARRFWPDGDAIGRRMFWPTSPSQLSTIDANTRWLTVIGVVRNAQLRGLMAESASGTSGTYYLPYAVTAPRDVGYVIRTEGEPTAIVRDVRSALAQVDREVPLFDIRTMSERTELALMSRTNTMHLGTLFAAVAVFLSAIGLYGVLAYLVTQRAREIGVRLAVGSTPSAIVGLVLREGLSMAIAGVALGAAGCLAFGRLVASQLYGIKPSDPWVMLLTTVTLSAAAALACIIPARRAAHVDVMRILSAP